jgi:hypothetical protein
MTMTGKLAFVLSLFALLIISDGQCYATGKQDDAMSLSQMKRRVMEAEAKSKRLIVELKNGKSVSGEVAWLTDHEFLVRHPDSTLFGLGKEETIAYADVKLIKNRNLFVNALKKIGEYVGKGGLMIVGAPLVGFMWAYSYLVFGEAPPDC